MAERLIVGGSERDRTPDQGRGAAPAGSLLAPRIRTSVRYARLGRLVALTDAIALELALLGSWVFHFKGNHFPVGVLTLLILGPVLWLAVFAGFRLYDLSRLSPAEEFRRTLEAVCVGVAVVGLSSRAVAELFFNRTTKAYLSLGWIGRTALLSLVLVFLGRQFWHKYMWRLRKRGELAYRTIILGTNEEASRIGEMLRSGSAGFLPLGLVRTPHVSQPWDGLPVLGSMEELPEIIRNHGVECVFIASSAVGSDVMKRVMKYLRRQDVEIRVSANMTEILSSRLTVQPIGELLALSLRPTRLSGSQAIVKRTFDLVVASVGIILTAPIWLIAAILIKTTSRGPVLYRQDRVGRGGELFRMIKFRTMVRHADRLVHDLADVQDGDGPLFKIRNDPRVTGMGRWMRKFSIDELPQLLNVIKGDMSLVGPRPMPSIFDETHYADWHRGRLEVLPGITGLWQVSGRSDMTWDECVRLDLFYIENWSIAYDLFILAKTVPAVFSHQGAF